MKQEITVTVERTISLRANVTVLLDTPSKEGAVLAALHKARELSDHDFTFVEKDHRAVKTQDLRRLAALTKKSLPIETESFTLCPTS